MKLYQYAKNKLIPLVNSILESSDQIGYINMLTNNETVSSICSGKIVHLEILQSDWLRRLWPISQQQDISKGFVQDHSKKKLNIE